MKRTAISITAIFSALLLCVPFAGCNKKLTQGKTEKIETISVWTNSGHTKKIMPGLVDEFNRTVGAEKGIAIDYVIHGGDYSSVITMAIASNQAPDMFKVQGGRRPFVERGEIMALEDLPDMDEFLKEYEGMLPENNYVLNGKTYGVPISYTLYGLLYNKDMFKKAGIVDANGEAKPPKTWEEMAEYAKILTNPSNKEYGIALPMKWAAFWDFEFAQPLMSSYGREKFDSNTKRYDFSIYKKPLEILLKIKQDESFFPGPESLDNDPARAQFAEGRIGMKFAASWDVGVLNDQFPAKCDWGVAPVPVMSECKTQYYQRCFTESFAEVSSSAKKKDLNKVATVFRWLNSDYVVGKQYQTGIITVPVKKSIVDNYPSNSIRTGNEDFCNLMNISKEPPTLFPIKLEGAGTADTYMKVWTGDMTPEQAVNDLTKRFNEALDKAVNDNTLDIDSYIKNADFNWEIK